jgi:hypothetical protein
MIARVGLALAVLLCVPDDASARPPRIDYMLECQGCHGADGRGIPGAVPDMRASLGRFLTVPGGREYLVRVPGSAQSPLDDRSLAELLNWMIRSFGPEEVARGFQPYDADEVASQRSPLTDVEPLRRELLKRIGQAERAAPGP